MLRAASRAAALSFSTRHFAGDIVPRDARSPGYTGASPVASNLIRKLKSPRRCCATADARAPLSRHLPQGCRYFEIELRGLQSVRFSVERRFVDYARREFKRGFLLRERALLRAFPVGPLGRGRCKVIIQRTRLIECAFLIHP